MKEMNTLSKEALFEQIKGMLVELFELSPDDIHLETRLADDLDLDSIDAVDLIVQLQKQTKKRIEPEAFKSVRTVGDVVQVISDLLQAA